ncbi:uncharacterized protein C2orf81 homolog [Polypterus senegalus]|uniref:uncharacterized protein C2orf81 homolog n=1 Tax=Polypterus senegalus TaxID=55291 RepID=UPI001962D169|nr:uncharacterized protein C2orf81 homolog [Polypterus senegalus]
MSRSAHSKTRPEKSRTPSSPTPHAAAIAPPPDIVPGRLTELDWATMVAKEEGEEVVYAVIEELMSRVMEESLHLYVKKELIPYTVSKVYERMLQVVQWRFMEPDKGEEVVDNPTWQEDEEPKPCRIDSWASGAVPVVYSHQKQCLQVLCLW